MADEIKQPVQNKNIKNTKNPKLPSDQQTQKKDQNLDRNFDRDSGKAERDQER